MRPRVKIIGYANDAENEYKLRTIYTENGGLKAEDEELAFADLRSLNKAINKCIAYAKHMTYDYAVSFVTA